MLWKHFNLWGCRAEAVERFGYGAKKEKFKRSEKKSLVWDEKKNFDIGLRNILLYWAEEEVLIKGQGMGLYFEQMKLFSRDEHLYIGYEEKKVFK